MNFTCPLAKDMYMLSTIDIDFTYFLTFACNFLVILLVWILCEYPLHLTQRPSKLTT